MPLWKWSGTKWEKCPWHSIGRHDKACLYGSGASLETCDHKPEKTVRFVMNHAFRKVEPNIWIGMDKPELFGKQLLDTQFCKVFRGNYASHKIGNIMVREFPEVYWADVEAKDTESIFFSNGINTNFYWNKNTMTIAIHLILWMGFKHITFSGIDLCGPSFAGHPVTIDKKRLDDATKLLEQETVFMQWFAQSAKQAHITICNTSSISKLTKMNEIVQLW